MKTLNDYFTKAANRPRTVSPERLAGFVSVGADAHNGSGKGWSRRLSNLSPGVVSILLLGITLAGGATAVIVPRLSLFHHGGNSKGVEASLAGRPSIIEGAGCPLTEFVGISGEGKSRFSPASLGTLPMLELTSGELARLGVEKLSDDGVALYYSYHASSNIRREVFRSDEADFPEGADVTVPQGVHPLSGPPRLITDDLGRLRRFYYTYDEIDSKLQDSIIMVQKKYAYLSDAVKVKEALDSMNNHPRFGKWFEELHRRSRSLIDFNRLVPVLVRSGRPYTRHDSLMGYCRPDIIIWFDPTPEMLTLLPSSWRERTTSLVAASKKDAGIRDQHKRIEKKEEQSVPELKEMDEPNGTEFSSTPLPELTQKETATEKGGTSQPIFNGETGSGLPLLMPNPGTLREIRLMPNPVAGIGVIHLRLEQSRIVAVSLHTIMGQRLTVLCEDRQYGAGEASIQLLFEGVPPGIYLLAVSTDQGELQVERVMVK